MFANTKILGQGALDAIKRSRPIYNASRSLRFAAGVRLGARRVEGISGRVHYNDFMLTSTTPPMSRIIFAARRHLSVFLSGPVLM